MSKKRTSPDPSEDVQINDDSDSVFQQEDNAKRVKLTTQSDATLQDLPMELIERILVKAVAMESTDTSRAKNVWEENATHVISRLTTVCSQWDSILTTNFFRNELQRTFDAQETIHLDILHQSQLPDHMIYGVVALKEEVFILGKPQPQVDDYVVHVYDRSDMAEARGVIRLPAGTAPRRMAACNVSNCLYILNRKPNHLRSVLRIIKTDEHQVTLSTVISDTRRQNKDLSVAGNGNLFLTYQKTIEQRTVISVYGPNGNLRYETYLAPDVYEYLHKIIPKSDGNFIVVSTSNQMKTKLVEFDMTGTIIRQYESSLFGHYSVCHADNGGRIAIAERLDRAEILDAQFNILQEFRPNGPHEHDGKYHHCFNMDYNRERNEIVTITVEKLLTIFRFTEEQVKSSEK